MIRKIFLTVLLLAISCKLFAAPAAAKDFSSFYKVTYEFYSSGEAEVTQEISLVNIASNLYVSQYSLSNMGSNISKIEAYDKVGPLKIKSEIKDETTIINLNFNENVVGKDKVLSFILKYRISNMAKKEGNLWQISVPKLANQENIDEYQLIAKIPLGFGKMSVVNPTPKSYESDGKFHLLTFGKEDISLFGVAATFGQYQTFDFKIIYDVGNDESYEIIEKIAVPPDTSYQTVYFSSLNPEPIDVQIDNDGNWLASYLLPPKEKFKIEVAGKVNIYAQPKKRITTLTRKDKYLSATKFWEANDEKIMTLARRLKTPENIYKFVVDSLSYDYQGVENNVTRKGALFSLEKPKEATCTQFTDLFVALTRAAGIPSREQEGYALVNNSRLKEISAEKDLLHAWPEYFDEERGGWIMVDPTWGNTSGGIDYFEKFDMSHFTFVIHGEDDSLPYSPGSYKESGSKEKQILVTLGNEEVYPATPLLAIEEVIYPTVYSMKKNRFRFVFRNMNGSSIYMGKLSLSSPADVSPKEWFFEIIPPFARFSADFVFKPKEILKDYSTMMNFQLNNQKISYNIKVRSLMLRLFVGGGTAIILILAALIISIKSYYNKKAKNVIV